MSQKTDKNRVSYKISELPDLTEEQRANLQRLASLTDSKIDTSDIPVMSDEQWRTASRRNLYRPVKQQITARVDADVLEWLKSKGEGYQTRLNLILRKEMLAELQGKAS
jgi:uncharacterized protein (DUF4415 family)